MSKTNLNDALEALYGLERRKSKLGLDGTRELLALLDHPERRFRTVHVAGTNGKGSTCARIERALRQAGLTTGLFTSPHLVDFRERIRVGGRWADEAWLAETLALLERRASPGATFFEVATALGFGWFAAQGVEWAVVEVGLGGRLDTTNVLEPEICAITAIGLDHTEILGDTLEMIAFEKAGIVKPGVPVVLGPGIAPAARAVIVEVARDRGAETIEARAPASASYDAANRATARAVLETLAGRGVALPAEAIERGLTEARWPGRFEQAPSAPRLWWDGAHNADGIAALARSWRAAALPPPAAIAIAVSRDKDVARMLGSVRDLAPGARLVATRSHSERALDPERVAAQGVALGFESECVAEVAAACERALALAAPHGLALLTGSLFAVGEAMQAFGGAPGEFL